jgi:hypothetical protein
MKAFSRTETFFAAYRDSVTRFLTSGFSTWISFPQASDYTIRAVSNFLKIRGDIRSLRCTTGEMKMKNSSSRKTFIISFGQLWIVELAYR